MYLFLDTETNHCYLNTKKDLSYRPYIAQISMMYTTEDELVVGEYHSYVWRSDWHMSEKATEFTGITDEDCDKYGLPLEISLLVFSKMIKMCKYLVCYNINFDLNVLKFSYDRIGKLDVFPNNFKNICLMKNTKTYLKRKRNTNLTEAYETICKKSFDPHKSKNDTIAAKELFFEMKNNGYVFNYE